ncbi:hypothetical protein TI39_contig395g00009 [Zymoseptoria brevis]|uniref:Uncharacterized protein n=1 Tax=Zymoseptoria brevis TaxID=1047168 RepID=A0A0F4GMV1_9PEZI|nr:hypothetical protein TI39_contig395g00009 [Zymoseptoria brevis]
MPARHALSEAYKRKFESARRTAASAEDLAPRVVTDSSDEAEEDMATQHTRPGAMHQGHRRSRKRARVQEVLTRTARSRRDAQLGEDDEHGEDRTETPSQRELPKLAYSHSARMPGFKTPSGKPNNYGTPATPFPASVVIRTQSALSNAVLGAATYLDAGVKANQDARSSLNPNPTARKQQAFGFENSYFGGGTYEKVSASNAERAERIAALAKNKSKKQVEEIEINDRNNNKGLKVTVDAKGHMIEESKAPSHSSTQCTSWPLLSSQCDFALDIAPARHSMHSPFGASAEGTRRQEHGAGEQAAKQRLNPPVTGPDVMLRIYGKTMFEMSEVQRATVERNERRIAENRRREHGEHLEKKRKRREKKKARAAAGPAQAVGKSEDFDVFAPALGNNASPWRISHEDGGGQTQRSRHLTDLLRSTGVPNSVQGESSSPGTATRRGANPFDQRLSTKGVIHRGGAQIARQSHAEVQARYEASGAADRRVLEEAAERRA